MRNLLPLLLGGTITTLKIFTLTLLFSVPLGALVARGRMSKNPLISGMINIYIMIMR
ncbi:MAG: amino acid ABC transporter permease, partial [Proteobacteria bacterium]|nr:amino acid ABC transporter permease [Pseudomonadota bacterium]